MVVDVDFKFSAVNEDARIILGWESSNKYIYIRVLNNDAGGCGTIQIVEKSGASQIVHTSKSIGGLGLAEWHSMRACARKREYEPDITTITAVITLGAIAGETEPEDIPKVFIDFDVSGEFGFGHGLAVGGSVTDIRFDNYSAFPHKVDKAGCPDCKADCWKMEEDFSYSDLTLATGNQNVNVLECWWRARSVASGEWRIEDEAAVCEVSGTGSSKNLLALRPGTGVNDFVASVDVTLPETGKASLLFTEGAGDGNAYRIEVEAADTDDGVLCNATQDKGYVRLVQSTNDDNLGSSSVIKEVIVAGLVKEEVIRLYICYNANDKRISARASGPWGSEGIHYDVEVTNPNAPHAFQLVCGDVDGIYIWDNFEMSRHAGEYETSDLSNCPSCGPPPDGNACEEFFDNFGDTVIDCRWEQTGTWTEGSGTVSTSGANASLIAKLDQTGTDVEEGGEIDDTVMVTVEFKGAAYSDKIRLIVGSSSSVYLLITLNSDISTAGTIKIFDSGGEQASQNAVLHPGNFYTAQLCYDGLKVNQAIGVVNGVEVEADVSPPPNKRGGFGTGATVGGTIHFDNAKISHQLNSEECGDCHGAKGDPCMEGICQNNKMLRVMKLRVAGVRNVHADYSCYRYNGTYIIQGSVACGGGNFPCDIDEVLGPDLTASTGDPHISGASGTFINAAEGLTGCGGGGLSRCDNNILIDVYVSEDFIYLIGRIRIGLARGYNNDTLDVLDAGDAEAWVWYFKKISVEEAPTDCVHMLDSPQELPFICVTKFDTPDCERIDPPRGEDSSGYEICNWDNSYMVLQSA
jgi:hypothetical protein